jgi:hypothetical protein
VNWALLCCCAPSWPCYSRASCTVSGTTQTACPVLLLPPPRLVCCHLLLLRLLYSDANTRNRLFDHHHCNHALPPRNRCLDVYLGHISTALWSLDCGCIGAHVARRCRSLGLGIRKRRQDQQAHRCRQENFGLHVHEQGARRKAFLSSSAWGCKHAIFWVQVRGGQGVLDIHTALNAISLTNQDLYMRARFYSIYRNRTLRSQFVVGLQKPTN